jgi:serine phosphatase RsbU (regulator of sigma subunit)
VAGLSRHTCDDPSETVTALHDELLSHVGGHLHDDAALLLLRMPAPTLRPPSDTARVTSNTR